MSDYSGIGDAMKLIAVLAAFALPTAIGSVAGLALATLGFHPAGPACGIIGLCAGAICAFTIARAA